MRTLQCATRIGTIYNSKPTLPLQHTKYCAYNHIMIHCTCGHSQMSRMQNRGDLYGFLMCILLTSSQTFNKKHNSDGMPS